MASLDAANNKAELPNPQSDIIDRTNNARFWLEAVDDEAWKMQRDIAAGLYEHEEDIVTYIMNKYVRDYGGYDDDDHPITKDEIWDEDERKTKWFKKLQATWAGPDPGSRVGFEADKDVPLKEDCYLGRGAMGEVYKATFGGHALAWKRIPLRRRIGPKDMKEIEILKKLSHTHTIKLVGTYTHRQSLGLLLYPVATCDLHTLFDM